MKLNRIIPFVLAGCLCVSFCACGGSAKQEPSAAAETAQPAETEAVTTTEAPELEQSAPSVMTWGDWTVDVPAGYKLKGGDFLDENDARYFSVRRSEFSFFDFKADGEERIMNNYKYNKDTYTNEQKDVKGTFGANEWTGFQYSDGYGGYGFEAYATVDGEMIRVSSAGYAFDDEMVNTVLSSLKHTPAQAAAPEETAPAEQSAPEGETAPAEGEPTEEEPGEGAPVYAQVLEFKDVTLGIKEGYTEKKNATPAQYVMENDKTGGKVSVWNSSGNAEKSVADTMSGQDYVQREEDLNGMHWVIGTNEGFYCFATTIGDHVFQITIDYGGTDEEMESLIFGVTPKS